MTHEPLRKKPHSNYSKDSELFISFCKHGGNSGRGRKLHTAHVDVTLACLSGARHTRLYSLFPRDRRNTHKNMGDSVYPEKPLMWPLCLEKPHSLYQGNERFVITYLCGLQTSAQNILLYEAEQLLTAGRLSSLHADAQLQVWVTFLCPVHSAVGQEHLSQH